MKPTQAYPRGEIFARFREGGKIVRVSTNTDSTTTAKLQLPDIKSEERKKLERANPSLSSCQFATNGTVRAHPSETLQVRHGARIRSAHDGCVRSVVAPSVRSRGVAQPEGVHAPHQVGGVVVSPDEPLVV